MPLSKARMRARKQIDRSNVKPMLNLTTIDIVKPKLDKLKTVGLTIEGNTILGTSKPACAQPDSFPWPLYNPSVHKPGDRVMMKSPYSKKLLEIVIPELDADGHPMPG